MQASLVYMCSRIEQDMCFVCCAAHLDLIEGQCRMSHDKLSIDANDLPLGSSHIVVLLNVPLARSQRCGESDVAVR